MLDAIQELGYSQNTAARDLARGKSSLLGLSFPTCGIPFFRISRRVSGPGVGARHGRAGLEHELRFAANIEFGETGAVAAGAGSGDPDSQIDPSVIDMVAAKHVAAVYMDLGRVDRGISNIRYRL